MRYIKYLVFIALVTAFSWFMLSGSSRPQAQPTANVATNLNSDILLETIQEWRISKNLPKYEVKDSLCDIAKIRLFDIQKDFSHDLFVSTVNRYFYKSNLQIAENLADVNYSESGLLNAWLNSPEHRENLDKNYRYTCIETSGRYAVQIFANY